MKLSTIILTSLLFLAPNVSAQETPLASEAWAELVGKRLMKQPAFAFVENNANLPNVLIYGDSISIDYTQQVRKNLTGKANVFRIFANGGDSKSFIPKMEKMHEIMRDSALEGRWAFEWDIIHFNVGLHDLKYVIDGKLNMNGKQVTSIEDYQKKLHNIVIYLEKLAPNAALIFATTTPVPKGAMGRVSGDSAKYNVAALSVLRDFPDVIINDLYGFTKPNHDVWWTEPGNVHYKSIGAKAQGCTVARLIHSQKIFKKRRIDF